MTVRGRNAAFGKLVTAPILALVPTSPVLLPSCAPFTPCPAPRFDNFSEALVGRWGYMRNPNDGGGFQNTLDGINYEDALATGIVEEVMRSCGGAVQGVRETDGVYLNRADDGFVYFPDGSYSSGPTSLADEQTSQSGRQDPQMTTTCLCFGTTRFLFNTSLLFDHSGVNMRFCAKHPEVLVKFRWSDTPEDVSRSIVLAMRYIAHNPKSDTGSGRDAGGPRCERRVIREVQCRMPSRGQAWMLPRAQWEQRVEEGSIERDATTSDDRLRDDDSSPSTKLGSTESAYGVDLMLGGSKCTVVRDEDELVQSSSDHESIKVLQVGVEFQGAFKALSRIYHPQGGLEKVVWTEGSLISG